MSRRTIKSTKRSCDRLWAQLVKSQAGGRCERCDKYPRTPHDLHAHHCYGRSDHRLRFDLRNGVSLCWLHHRWAEEHPLEFAEWFEKHRPEDTDYLYAQRQKGILKRDLDDYLKLEEGLKQALAIVGEKVA